MKLPERINWKAVLLGVATDIGGSLALSVVLTLLLGFWLATQGTPTDNLDEAMMEASHSGAFLLVSVAAGLALTVLGGYVAARMAREHEAFHAGMVGVIATAFGLLFFGQAPIWIDAANLLVVVPAALYGGHLAQRRRQLGDAARTDDGGRTS